jgi:aldose sugar dehydrogenase
MTFRKDINKGVDIRIEKSVKFFIMSFIMVFATGLLIQYQLPIAIAQSVNDPSLNVESFVEGLNSPTSMAFLDGNNIMILEKDGLVRLVSNGQLQPQPVLEIPVDSQSERGLLGIAVEQNTRSDNSSIQNGDAKNIFLYYTEPGDVGGELKNRVYKYTWNGQTLENPTLILDLPAIPGPNHDGGKLMIGPDNPLSKYFAYGVRNSFGLTFDPVTKTIWDTENGPASNDEINIVKPGFNSGWQTIMGPMINSGNTEEDLVNFEGSHYADPILTWLDPPALTDIEFLNSTSLGEAYSNNVFVGDNNNGNLYYFEMNPERNGFIVDTVPDLVVDNEEEQSSIVFGSGFGSITDLVTGPDDGFLYILSHDNGIIYRITPT